MTFTTLPNIHVLEDAANDVIFQLGFNTTDEHFRNTPHRVAKMFAEYAKKDPAVAVEILNVQFSSAQVGELVIVKDISFSSLCAHHFLPYVGKATFAYIPRGRVVGLSKIPRAIKYLAKQPTVQEELTQLIINLFEEHVSIDCMVVIEAVHECMRLRGVQEQTASMVTSAVRGVFRANDAGVKNEVLQLMK